MSQWRRNYEQKVRFWIYFGSGAPKSRQIFRAKNKFISLCRGTVEDRFKAGFIKTLCFDPSRTNTHPLEIRCCIKTRRFMNRDYHATLNCSRTTLPFVSLRLSILFTEKIRRSASFRFSFVSLRVLPCVFTPGISSTQPKYHLPLFLYTAVNCCIFLLISSL